MLNIQIFVISLMLGLSIIGGIIILAVFVYEAISKKDVLSKKDDSDWLFANFHQKVYDIFMGDHHETVILGVTLEKYKRECAICHEAYDEVTLLSKRLEGLFGCIICLFLGAITMTQFILCMPFFILAIILFYSMYYAPYAKIHRKAEARRYQVGDILPRYLSILEKALDQPLMIAIKHTASHYDNFLTHDILDVCENVNFGVYSWEEGFEELAYTYQLDSLTGFVMDLIQSEHSGMNIKDSVNKKVYILEQERIYQVEEEDQKNKQLVLIPFVLFTILPILAFLCIPMALTILGGGM